jgi:hypothetical protein
MHAFLRHLPEFGRPFPIPIRTNGAEAVFEASRNPKGWMVLCVHLPLTQLILSALVEMHHPPTGVVSNLEALRGGRSPVWGKATGLPGLVSDGNVLLKVQRILNRGGSVTTMVDTALDCPLNGNMLRLIGLTGARAVFSSAALQASGEILVQFCALPDPYCRSEEAVTLNLEFIQSKLDEILSRQSALPTENHWPANQDPLRTPSR